MKTCLKIIKNVIKHVILELLMRKFTQNQYIYFAVVLFILLFRVNPCFADFTIEDERKLGKEFYDQMEQNHLILKNEALTNYVTKIGNLIQAQANKVPFEFHFLSLTAMQ